MSFVTNFLSASSPMRVRLVVVIVGLASFTAVPHSNLAQTPVSRSDAEPERYGPAEPLGRLTCPDVDESSGLAVSRRTKGLLWTHNDSGGGPRLYALDLSGQHVATITVKGARAVDWEDMASFQFEGRAYLLVGDVGDNKKVRKSYSLYLIPEPVPEDKSLQIEREVRFRFESEPHDCESIAFDPTSRSVLMVAKTWKPFCDVFLLNWPAHQDSSRQMARKIGTLPLAGVTGMDISPDGRRAILTSYMHAYEYRRLPGETWANAFSKKGREIKMPPRKQGEAICYGADGRTLFLTSEKRLSPLFRVAPE